MIRFAYLVARCAFSAILALTYVKACRDSPDNLRPDAVPASGMNQARRRLKIGVTAGSVFRSHLVIGAAKNYLKEHRRATLKTSDIVSCILRRPDRPIGLEEVRGAPLPLHWKGQ